MDLYISLTVAKTHDVYLIKIVKVRATQSVVVCFFSSEAELASPEWVVEE